MLVYFVILYQSGHTFPFTSKRVSKLLIGTVSQLQKQKKKEMNWAGNHVSCCESGPPCASSGGSMCHVSVESEHQVNFSTAAAAQQRLMRVRYAIGGGLIAD